MNHKRLADRMEANDPEADFFVEDMIYEKFRWPHIYKDEKNTFATRKERGISEEGSASGSRSGLPLADLAVDVEMVTQDPPPVTPPRKRRSPAKPPVNASAFMDPPADDPPLPPSAISPTPAARVVQELPGIRIAAPSSPPNPPPVVAPTFATIVSTSTEDDVDMDESQSSVEDLPTAMKNLTTMGICTFIN